MVNSVFANVASSYDVMNDLMSAGLHRLWKDHVVSTLDPQPADGKRSSHVTFLDVAGGTGDVAFRIVDRLNQVIRERGISSSSSSSSPAATSVVDGSGPRTDVIVCDINPSMLAVGEQRARDLGYMNISPSSPSSPDGSNRVNVSFMEGNAELLTNVADESVDAYTICFGIRNCTHVDRVLEQAYRVLKPGGIFLCLEFSQVENMALRQLYDLYSFNVIPLMGQFVANDRDSYQYLVESIRKFPDQETFKSMIQHAGFKHVRYENLTFGVVAVHMGVKL